MRRAAAVVSLGALSLCLGAQAEARPKPAVDFLSASRSNYTPVGSRKITHVIIHTIEGSASSARNWFRNRRAKVSAHYVIDFNGKITQMVKDKDRAWHARGFNRNSIGLEHAGYASRNQWTDAMYRSSANLTRWLCDTYRIPKTRKHIKGHSEVNPGRKSDPGRHFDWDYYMRLVRGEGATAYRPDEPQPNVTDPDEAGEDESGSGRNTSPNHDDHFDHGHGPDPDPNGRLAVRPLRPGEGQVVGLLHMNWRGGSPSAGYPGLTVEWFVMAGRQRSYEVQVQEAGGGSLRYASGAQTSAETRHTVTARLKHGRTYRWRVRSSDGRTDSTSEWRTFRTDFEPPKVVALAPTQGKLVESTPALRWTYDDPDGGEQASYRVWVDDDADHASVVYDSKELNGATTSHFVRLKLKPDHTYHWRVMGYDGHGNPSFSSWETFTTAPDFVDTEGEGLTVRPLEPLEHAVLMRPPSTFLRWAYHSGENREQSGVRVQLERIDETTDATTRLIDETFSTSARSYRSAAQPEGSYRWRVGVYDGQEVAWTTWTKFQVTARDEGIVGHLDR